jgi:hypothetical protein
MEAYDGRQFVGIDLHRRRSVIVRSTETGQRLESVRIVNDPDRLAALLARAGEAPEVVPQPRLQPTMIGFDPVVAILLGEVHRRWD